MSEDYQSSYPNISTLVFSPVMNQIYQKIDIKKLVFFTKSAFYNHINPDFLSENT